MQYCLSGKERKVLWLNCIFFGLELYIFLHFILYLDINNKDIRDANNAHTDSDDEGESMDWYKANNDLDKSD